ncbi:MAG: hypothetical protein ABUL52_00050, partial [Solimonas sp.]
MKILFWKHGTNKDAFRLRYIEAAQKEFPHLRFEIDDEYGVKVCGSERHNSIEVWLERGYEEFKKSPKNAGEILLRHIKVLRGIIDADGSIDLEFIVPVIKHKNWPVQQRAIVQNTYGSEAKVEYWTEDYNSEITIVFAESKAGLRYPSPADFLASGMALKELRMLAMKNLQQRCTGRMVTGSDGLYLVSVGGNLDASLILLDDVWSDARIRIEEDSIVAVPDRNTFMVVDSADTAQVYRAAASAIDFWRTEQYPISPK